MQNLFELMTQVNKDREDETESYLGMRIRVSGCETICAVTKVCHSYKDLALEVESIKKGLDDLLSNAKRVFEKASACSLHGIKPHMTAEEVWAVLSGIGDNETFVTTFNSLEETKRREVAEHVLTKCNIFTGKASVFSSRYADDTALME